MAKKKTVKTPIKPKKKSVPKMAQTKVEFAVIDEDNKLMRIYSPDDHKKKASKLAEALAKKNGWKVYTIEKKLICRYEVQEKDKHIFK